MGIFGVHPGLAIPQGASGPPPTEPLADSYIWLDFTDATTLDDSVGDDPSTGEEIYVARDQSGNGRDFSRNTAGPNFVTGGKNSNAYADFVATGNPFDQLRSDGSFTWSDATRTSIYFVEAIANPGQIGIAILSAGDLGNNDILNFTGNTQWRINCNNTQHNMTTFYDMSDSSSFYVLIFRVDDTANRVWITLFSPDDGDEPWTWTRTLTNSEAYLSSDPVDISGNPSRLYGYTGRMYEYALYDSKITETKMTEILEDRATKYSFTAPDCELSLAPFSPIHWWDVTDASNRTIDTGKVTAIANKGSGSGDLSQATANNKPTLTTSEHAGFDAATFDDGSFDQWLEASFGANVTGDYTLVVAYKTETTLVATENYITCGYDAAGTADSDISIALGILGGGTDQMRVTNSGGSPASVLAATTDNFYIAMIRVDDSRSDQSAFCTNDTTGASITRTYTETAIRNMIWGGKDGGAGNFNGHIFEVAIFPGLSGWGMNAVGSTLAAKYNRQWTPLDVTIT